MFRFFDYAKLMFFLDMHKFHAKYLAPIPLMPPGAETSASGVYLSG